MRIKASVPGVGANPQLDSRQRVTASVTGTSFIVFRTRRAFEQTSTLP